MTSGSGSGLGLKKGAWTAHEDMLLKNCIEKYGEGKWHLIPLRTVSFDFNFRWSLIAGRIPGRTANDVKNYWNTHIQPRSKQHKKEPDADESLQDATLTIIKPQPHIISKTINMCMTDNRQIVSPGGGNLTRTSNAGANNNFNVSSLTPNVLDDKINQYLQELFDDGEVELEGDIGWSFGEFSA
ncbi:unnamed protein product [Lactuca virosa]|uniref:Uncharacterized protein n=1 Tax=Lactuca virosa TaxID=75947 RepID=A0AAU9M482_9ASTR|nr:unnamed protein product [Lactuca virosa]